VFEKAKSLYLIWYEYYRILPTAHRYTLGQKVDKYFTEIIESIAIAAFLKPEEKIPYVRLAIRKSDVLKIFLNIIWETKSLDNKKYILLSEKLNEIGKMLGGWNGQLLKQNSPKNLGEK
jgi:predicted CoA-binding protein